MKDVMDLNPDLTYQELQRWIEIEENPAMVEYFENCLARRTGE